MWKLLVVLCLATVVNSKHANPRKSLSGPAPVVPLPNDSNSPVSYLTLNGVPYYSPSQTAPSVAQLPNDSNSPISYFIVPNYGSSQSAPSVVPLPNDSNSPISYLPNNGVPNYGPSPSAPSVVPLPNHSSSPISYLPNNGELNYDPSPPTSSVLLLPNNSNSPVSYVPNNGVLSYNPSSSAPSVVLLPNKSNPPISYSPSNGVTNYGPSPSSASVQPPNSPNSLPTYFPNNNVPDVQVNAQGPQVYPNNEKPSNCENSEVLFRVWNIFSNLLDSGGKPVTAPDVEQIKFALTLIKKYLEEVPQNSQNIDMAKKLLILETDLLNDKGVVLNDKRPLRSLLNFKPISTDSSQRISFQYELPTNIRPSCREPFLNLIQTAQESYHNLARSSVCSGVGDSPAVFQGNDIILNPGTYNPLAGLLNQNPFNPVSNMQIPNTNSDGSLKNDVLNLLEKYKPRPQENIPYYSPIQEIPNDLQVPDNINGLNPYSPQQIYSNGVNSYSPQNTHPGIVSPIQAPSVIPIHADVKNVLTPNMPIQVDFTSYLKHMKELANRINAQNNPNKNLLNPVNPNLANTGRPVLNLNNLVTPNDETDSIAYPLNIKPDYNTLQKLMHNVPKGSDYNSILNKYLNSYSKSNKPSQNVPLNPNYNQKYADNINKLLKETLKNLNPEMPGMYSPRELDNNNLNRVSNLVNPDQNPIHNNLLQNPNINNLDQNPNLNNLYKNPYLNKIYQNPNINTHYQNPNLNNPIQYSNLNNLFQNTNIDNPKQNLNINNLYQNANVKNPGQNVLAYQVPIHNGLTANPYNYGLVPNKYATNELNGITNAAKLNAITTPNGEIELTYVLKRPQPLVYQPFYFIKYRLPYNSFVQNLGQIMAQKSHLRTAKSDLYKQFISQSNATEISPDLAHYSKEEVQNLVMRAGSLLNTRFIRSNETEAKQMNVALLQNFQEMNPPAVPVPKTSPNQDKDAQKIKDARPKNRSFGQAPPKKKLMSSR